MNNINHVYKIKILKLFINGKIEAGVCDNEIWCAVYANRKGLHQPVYPV